MRNQKKSIIKQTQINLGFAINQAYKTVYLKDRPQSKKKRRTLTQAYIQKKGRKSYQLELKTN